MSVTDYRTYILSAYEEKKKSNVRFSLRAFARFLDLSPSTLSEIINRHHTLSTRSAKKVLEKIKLGSEDSTLFMKLVQEEISFRKKAGSEVQASKKLILKVNLADKKLVKKDIEDFLLNLFEKYHVAGGESIYLKDLLNESMLVISSNKRSIINNPMELV